MDTPTVAARILTHLAAQGAPLADFIDSWKPRDLDDLAKAVGITPAEAESARVYLASGGELTP